MANPNVLSERYATSSINNIFDEKGKIIAERELWIAVMKAQRDLGLNISNEDIEKYEKSKNEINLNRIKEIERETRHDVKAKINAFVEISGAQQQIHKGMTSRDLTDNVEQMQIKKASQIIFGKYISVLRHFCDKAEEYQDIILTARTHHQAAQPTLFGRRFSMWAEELLFHLEGFESFLARFPLRSIKGPVGTQFDMLKLLGSPEKVQRLEELIAKQLGFVKVLDSPGQVYPRSLDYALISDLSFLAAAPENFANTMRLMSGYELVTEGFKEGQVGSSAMPHKMNTRSSERIWGLSELLKMYANGASRISGHQWEEGDVSCSVPRRIINTDVFYASDGLCETTLTVLNEMGVYPAIINKEVDKYLPFLATTELLQEAILKGIGREEAHKIIKKYTVQEALNMRKTGSEKNNLAETLGTDSAFVKVGITKKRIETILADKAHFIGNARIQIDNVREKANDIINRYSKQACYEPGEIL